MSYLRIILRRLARERGFTLTVVTLLALGVGSSTAVYTLLDQLLFSPLAYPESARLIWIQGTGGWMRGADFLEIRHRFGTFENAAAFIEGSWTVSGDGREAAKLSGARVSRDFFDVLRVHPALGGEFSPGDYHAGRDMDVIFSFRFWQQRYGGDPGILARHVTLDGVSYEVRGVMPAGFPLEWEHDMWAPLPDDSPFMTGRRWRIARVLGRLKGSAALRQAQAEVNALAGDLAARYPDDRGLGLRLTTFLDQEVNGIRRSLWTFAAAAGCVLLIACLNVAGLLLARGSSRTREFAIRAAVGASRVELVTQLLKESLVLALAGGVIAFPLAVAAVRMLLTIDPKALPRAQELHANASVFAFALIAAIATVAIFGVAPALAMSRVNFTEALKESSRGSPGRRVKRLRAALIVIEVALGVLLFWSAGLMMRSLVALAGVDPGYRVSDVLSAQISLTGPAYRDIASCRRFFEQAEERIARIPGVDAAGATNSLPLSGLLIGANIWVDSTPRAEETKIHVDNRVVTPGYFRAMGVPLIAGRYFDARDRADSPNVVIINETFAREFFPLGDAIGRRITVDLPMPWTGQIVGVVGSYRELDLAEAPRREMFTVYSQTTVTSATLVASTRGEPSQYAAPLRAAITALDPGIAVYNEKTMRQQVGESLTQARLRSALLAFFAAVALVLAAAGVYGMIGCAVAERRQEIGIRMALGASAGEIRRMVVVEGLKCTAIGLTTGSIAAAAASRLISSFLYGVSAADPATFTATIVVFLGAAAGASYLPARRATRADPLAVLRDL